MTATAYGKKYDKALTIAEIAALVRKEIKARINTGTLPAGKYSVRSEHFSGGQAIRVNIEITEPGFRLFNQDWLGAISRDPHFFHPCVKQYSKLANLASTAVKDIVEAYNFDGSDTNSDYFNVNFYFSSHFDWKWEEERKGIEMEEMKASKPAPVAAPKNDVVELSVPESTPEPKPTPKAKAELALGDFVQVRFPSVNKNSDLEENDRRIAEDDCRIDNSNRVARCKIEKILKVPAVVFDALGMSLLEDNELWEKIGGRSGPEDFDKFDHAQICNDKALLARWLRECWVHIVLVTDGKRSFAVNTEGYAYARYVGRLV